MGAKLIVLEAPLKFYEWLLLQKGRQDAIGTLARHAERDRFFPKESDDLWVILLRYEGMKEHRAAAKRAHREWRRAA